jgi:DMSO/TMAO reductase YedYZ molybdopterin-dependent catalytic subunit
MDLLKLDLAKAKPDAPTERERQFQVALLAALVCILISFLVRFGFDMPLIPELMAQAFFAILPINFIALVVGFLGPFAKHLAFLGFVVIYAAALTAAAFLFQVYQSQTFAKSAFADDRNTNPIPQFNSMAAMARFATFRILGRLAGFGFLLWLLTLTIIIPILGGGWFGGYLRQGMVITSLTFLIVYAIFVLALGFIAKLYMAKPEVAQANNHRFSRRRVLRGIGFAVLAVGAYDIARSLWDTWFQANAGRVSTGNGTFPNLNGLALEITPTKDFYQVSKNPFDPDVDVKHWRLEVSGLVETPLMLSYQEIKSLPAVEQYATLECIDNPVGGNLIGNALWRGVPLKALLEVVKVADGVRDIVLYASDGYSDSIPLERAMQEATLLVYEMNGEPLSGVHGFPLRLLVPGIFGMKNVKWITRIEAVNVDFKGYWQKRGWDDKAEYKTMSRIDTPDSSVKGGATISGIAFAGDRQISRVEVSTDSGKTWETAELKPALSPYSWVLWHKAWAPQQKGKLSIKVRATDGRGDLQTSQYTAPDPSGATGLHSIIVTSE